MHHGQLTLTEGLLSARAMSLGNLDAAVSGDIAGIEIELETANVYVGPQESYRGNLVLDLSMHPDTMAALRDKLAITLPGPAFTDPEWRTIAHLLREYAATPNYDETAANTLADRIEEGLNRR